MVFAKHIINTFLILTFVYLSACNNNKSVSNLSSSTKFNINTDSVKTLYGDKFLKLRSIVNKYDPVGLISSGAPQDEYEPEVTTIITKLNSNLSENEVYDLVFNEFDFWFGGSTTGPKSSYKSLSKDVYLFAQALK